MYGYTECEFSKSRRSQIWQKLLDLQNHDIKQHNTDLSLH